jgi:hypothetical protein
MVQDARRLTAHEYGYRVKDNIRRLLSMGIRIFGHSTIQWWCIKVYFTCRRHGMLTDEITGERSALCKNPPDALLWTT